MAAECVGSMILHLNGNMMYLHALHTASVVYHGVKVPLLN